MIQNQVGLILKGRKTKSFSTNFAKIISVDNDQDKIQEKRQTVSDFQTDNFHIKSKFDKFDNCWLVD